MRIMLVALIVLPAGFSGCLWHKSVETPTPQAPTTPSQLPSTPAPATTPPPQALVTKVVEIALNDEKVKEALGSEPYEVGEVGQTTLFEEPGVYFIYLYLGERERPGITLRVFVDTIGERVRSISRELRPRELTEGEKAEAKRIALSDPEVLEWIGDKGYQITQIGEYSWTEIGGGKEAYYVFPAVEFNIPPDPNLPGVILQVFVDLKAGEIVRIFSHFRKPLPPPPSPER